MLPRILFFLPAAVAIMALLLVVVVAIALAILDVMSGFLRACYYERRISQDDPR